MPNFQHSSQYNISSFSELDDVISTLRHSILYPTVIYLYGNLGVGKTTFTQHWLHQVGVKEVITSPTYNIVNEYEVHGKSFIHADLYRIGDPEELLYLDVREWRSRAAITLIEWPERGKGVIPSADVIAQLSLKGNERLLLWQTTA